MFNLNLATQILAVYLLIINIITFGFFGFDKMRSEIADARRIREKTLWFLALIGGSAGALLGMHFFRHKTKKLSFQAVLAIILAMQIWLIYYLLS
jgi:uncharacterized membrane protein YsdA (DUF1294 family)